MIFKMIKYGQFEVGKKRLISKRGEKSVMSITATKEVKDDFVDKIVEKKFYIACEEDDSKLVKEFLSDKVINPCDMGYKFLRYAIGKKCEKIVDTMLESDFFNNFPEDTKYSLKIASKLGDTGFAMYMLKAG